MVEVAREVRPRWPFRLPGGAPDGVLRRRRAGGIERLLHVEGAPAVVRVTQPARARVVFVAGGDSDDVAEEALARMRFALGVDDDLRAFYDRFRDDPVIGRSVRARPDLRVVRRLPARHRAHDGRQPAGLGDRGGGAHLLREVRRLGGPGWRAPPRQGRLVVRDACQGFEDVRMHEHA